MSCSPVVLDHNDLFFITVSTITWFIGVTDIIIVYRLLPPHEALLPYISILHDSKYWPSAHHATGQVFIGVVLPSLTHRIETSCMMRRIVCHLVCPIGLELCYRNIIHSFITNHCSRYSVDQRSPRLPPSLKPVLNRRSPERVKSNQELPPTRELRSNICASCTERLLLCETHAKRMFDVLKFTISRHMPSCWTDTLLWSSGAPPGATIFVAASNW